MASLTFDKARWFEDRDGFWLAVRTKERAAAAQFCAGMADKPHTAELKEQRKKRSLDANAYFWVLAGELAARTGRPPDGIYRDYVRDIGGNYDVIPVREDRIEAWDRLWCDGHIGRMTVDIGPCRNVKGYHNIKTYIGSSDYDNRQMSRLIDLAVEDCKEYGIETMTPEELARLKEDWHA